MNAVMLKLYTLEVETSDEPTKKKGAKGKEDKFALLKKDMAGALKEVRQQLKDRDELLGKDPRSREAVMMSSACRKSIRELKEDAESLRDILDKEEAKLKKNKKAKPTDQADLDNRRAILENVHKHIEEVERLEKRRYVNKEMERASQNRAGLVKRTATGAGGKEVLPSDPTMTQLDDLDTEVGEGLRRLQRNDEEIDRDVEEISAGVAGLRQIAVDMGNELRVQGQMLDTLDGKVEEANTHIKKTNRVLKETIEKVAKGDKMMCYFILIAVVLAIGFFIYQIYFKKNS